MTQPGISFSLRLACSHAARSTAVQSPRFEASECGSFTRRSKEIPGRVFVSVGRHQHQAVKRNQKRFPCDFVFQLTAEEKTEVITDCDHLRYMKYYKGLPYAFTECGAIMAANVLKSETAIEASVFVVRAFVRLRHMLSSHADLSRRLDQLEQKYDGHFKIVFDAIRELMKPPPLPPRRRIGFNLGSNTRRGDHKM